MLTFLQYMSYFAATGSLMSQHERDVSWYSAESDVTLDDAAARYGHKVTLQYFIRCGFRTAPVTFVLGIVYSAMYNSSI